MIRLFKAEALEWLINCKDKYDTIFMDPPDNIGLKYEGCNDKRSDYYSWLESIILKSMFLGNVVWISYYYKHDLKVKAMVNWIINNIKPSWEARTFIWRFTFGQYRETDCGSGYRPILRLSKPGVKWNCDEIRITSKRMLINDSRSKGPRVPDDCWEFPDDYWEFPRVTGNSPERRAWCPTQHPELLLERIVKMSPGSKILELFTGSGTMIRVVKRLNINRLARLKKYCQLVEIDLDTVDLNIKQLVEEHPDIKIK